MTRFIALTTTILFLTASFAVSQEKAKPKTKPNINESKEYPNVIHSPSANSTPKVFRSVLQMELVVKKGDRDAEVVYANGTVVTKDGLIISVVDAPGTNDDENGGIESATALKLDGSSAAAKLVSYEADYGVAIFKTEGLELRPLSLSTARPVAERRVSWHAVYKNGRRTVLYSRPLRVYKSTHQVADVEDLCLIIDRDASSALGPERSGSALISLDGKLLGLMGRLKHWDVSPKNAAPRTKTAWAVPAHVIARLIEKANS